jgi:exodeoxyribonuclease VII small subunit
MPKSGKTAKQPSYGQAASRLEEILVKIEEGQVDIDELSGLVQEAAELVTLCRDKIQAAEVQVKTITEQLERDVPDTPDPADTRST